MSHVQSFAVRPFRHREGRRDQRLLLPEFRVVLDGYILSAVNWSLGGLLLHGRGPREAVPGRVIRGLIAGPGRNGQVSRPFDAEVIRLEDSPPAVALRFAGPGIGMVDFLDSCLRRHLSRATP